MEHGVRFGSKKDGRIEYPVTFDYREIDRSRSQQ